MDDHLKYEGNEFVDAVLEDVEAALVSLYGKRGAEMFDNLKAELAMVAPDNWDYDSEGLEWRGPDASWPLATPKEPTPKDCPRCGFLG